jgi:uncharacterized membrane protein
MKNNGRCMSRFFFYTTPLQANVAKEVLGWSSTTMVSVKSTTFTIFPPLLQIEIETTSPI